MLGTVFPVMCSTAKPLVRALPTLTGRPPGRRLRVILLSQYFPPEVGATQSRIQAFAEHLSGAGHKVTVICEFPNHPQGIFPPEYRGRVFEDDRSNPYRILRVWVMAAAEKTPRAREYFYLSYMALATAVAPLAGRADVVFATSPPLFAGAAGLAVARFNLAPFVLDVRDLWPEAAVALQQLSGGRALKASWVLERVLYQEAAVVTAVTKPFCDHIDRVRGHGPPTVLLPNGTLDRFFDEADTGEARAWLGATDRELLITYAGTLGIAQALPQVLDAAATTGAGIRWALVGEGALKEQLRARAADEGLSNVVVHDGVPIHDVPPFLAASDALLVTLSGHPTFADFVPSKLMDCMAAGRPVLLSAAGEAVRILERAGAGIAVTPENPEALAEGARWLAEHRAEAAEMGERGRAFARKRLRSTQAERLEQLLLDLVGR